jgi:hypothetical protein
LMVTWCSMVLAIIIIPGKPLTQYFMQLMLPVSLYAGNFFSDNLSKPVWLNRIIRYPYGTAILAVFIIVNVLFKKHDHFNKPDMPRTVASYLKTIMQPDDDLFTGNYDHILYFLLEKDSPTKYVHRTLLCYEHHQKTLQIDVPKEMNNIMNKKIDYIVMKGAYCFEPMNQYISDNYSVIRAFKDSINVYKRKAIDLGSE